LATRSKGILLLQQKLDDIYAQSGVADEGPKMAFECPLEKAVFPKPGMYCFELLAGEDVAEVCTIFVTKS